MENPLITVTTLSGSKVTAPLAQWVSALILRLPPGELEALLAMVEHPHHAPLIALSRDVRPIPADPAEFLRPDGRPR